MVSARPSARAPATGDCPLGAPLGALGRSYALPVLLAFRRDPRPRRFRALRREVGAPANVLSRRLRELEGLGLLARDARPGPVPEVSYAPTPRFAELGRHLDDVSDLLGAVQRVEPPAIRPPSA